MTEPPIVSERHQQNDHQTVIHLIRKEYIQGMVTGIDEYMNNNKRIKEIKINVSLIVTHPATLLPVH
jgi:hypothetical protein